MKRILPLTMLLFLSCSNRGSVPATVIDNPELPQVTLNGITFHAEAFGDPANPTVIALHGGPGQDYKYIQDLKALSDDYYVVFYDQRGSGLSERVPKNKISMEAFLADLDAFVVTYGGGQSSFIGHSWGAMLATAYAGRHPDKVETLILAEPGFLDQQSYDWFIGKSGMDNIKPTGTMVRHGLRTAWKSLWIECPDKQARSDYFYYEFLLGLWAQDNPMAKYFKDNDLANGNLEMNRMGALVNRTMMQSAMDKNGNMTIDFLQGIENFKGKTLFITGSENTLTGGDHQQYYLQFFNNAEIQTIHAGHTMFSEAPEEVLPLIRNALSP